MKSVNHLESIHNFISRDSITYANRFIKTLIKHTFHLESFPLMGRIVPEFNNPEIRELIFKEYRIIYKVKETKDIDILAVMHGNRKIEHHL